MDEPVVTSIRVPRRIWVALRALAERRACERGGGKPSVSGVVAELVSAETQRQAEGRVND